VTPTIRSAFTHFFTDAARRVELRDDRLVVLDDMRRVLLVEHGEVDLFAVRLEDGQPTGRWTRLCRVSAGTALLGAPRGPRHSIVGRAVPGAVLSLLPAQRLAGLSAREAVADHEAGRMIRTLPAGSFAVAVRELVGGIEAGIVALDYALPRDLPPRRFVPLAPRGVTSVADQAAVRSIDGVRWVEISQGFARQSVLTGRLTVGGQFCLTERDWLVTEGPTRLASLPTAALLADGSLWARLITHTARLLYAVDRSVERRESAEREALRARAARESGAVQAAARSYDAVARNTSARVRLTDVASDPPDLAAMRLVASHMGFSVRTPAGPDHPGRKTDSVRRIALANGVRTREILLDGSWWKRDIGPLLGRRKADGQVLALLPVKGTYVVADPAANRVTRLTKTAAAKLDNRGTALYRPLPPGANRFGTLLRFALSGGRHDVLRILFTGMIVAVTGLLAPIMTGRVLGDFVLRSQRGLIVEGSLLVIGGAFVAAAVAVVQNVAALRLEGRSVSLLQSAVWSRLLSLPTSFFSRYSTGELATSALGVNAVQETLSGVATTAALGLLTGSVNLILVFFYDISLALIAVGLVAVCVAVCSLAGYREVHWERRLYDQQRLLSARVFQILIGLPKLRVAAAEDRAFVQWSATFIRARAIAVRARRVQNLLITFNATFPLMCSIVIFGIVAGPLHGQISIAAFLSFNAALILLIAATLQFSGVAITTLEVVPMMERIKPILQEEPEAAGGAADPGDLSGQITLSNVSFRYGEDNPLALDNVSFNVDPGEFVAIVGPTGCGKSTLLRLLLGFETPTAGAVLFDGQEMTQLEAGAVRRQCGVVLQNGQLLAGDIKSNIIGSSGYTIEDAWAAARMAGVDKQIAAMPMNMHTVLSEGATTLSGGQRQRIMIARALVSRPRIILFDEATSALDNPTQKIVAESMRHLNATRIIIAHRLSSVAEADWVIVLDKGRIVQRGRYEELLADQGGLFASLASQQLT
jgi:NHLM bacteriocin system ABC transporter ATP-binding protein